jgi:hypothetical protein
MREQGWIFLCLKLSAIVSGICRIAAKIFDMMLIRSKIDQILSDQHDTGARMVNAVFIDEDVSHNSSVCSVKKPH